MTDFRDLVDLEGVTPEEEARLRRIHDLLLLAGPPVELPPALERVPAERGRARGELVELPLPRRRTGALVLLAAALAAIAFGGGYLLGHSKAKPAVFSAARVVPMHGSGGALAVIRIAHPDPVGNWPMEVQVTGLPTQAQRTAYYELWLTRNGKPTLSCGTFRVHGHTTTVHLSVPYTFAGVDGWVVTAQGPGRPEPGPVVLTT